MDTNRLVSLDQELRGLEQSYDVAVEQGSEDPHRLQESHFKLRKIIRKNREWRKALIELLESL